MLALFKLGHYLTDIDCYEKLTTRREARQQMQWTFRSSIAMKQMEKKERKVRDLLILNVIVVVPNHNPNDDIECMKKPSISEQQQRY